MKLGVANVLSRRTWILACLPSVSAENHSRTDRSAKLVQMAYMGVVPNWFRWRTWELFQRNSSS